MRLFRVLLKGIMVYGALLLVPARVSALTAKEVMDIARSQFTVPSEIMRVTMDIYRGGALLYNRNFIMAKSWDGEIESIRVDFLSPITLQGSVDSLPVPDLQYLLKRRPDEITQWFWTRDTRRVRKVSYCAVEPLVDSDLIFYDLTPVTNFGDYVYQFEDSNEELPVIIGMPKKDAVDLSGGRDSANTDCSTVPYARLRYKLEKYGLAYRILLVDYFDSAGKKKTAELHNYDELVPGIYRAHKILIKVNDKIYTDLVIGRMEIKNISLRYFDSLSLDTARLDGLLPK